MPQQFLLVARPGRGCRSPLPSPKSGAAVGRTAPGSDPQGGLIPSTGASLPGPPMFQAALHMACPAELGCMSGSLALALCWTSAAFLSLPADPPPRAGFAGPGRRGPWPSSHIKGYLGRTLDRTSLPRGRDTSRSGSPDTELAACWDRLSYARISAPTPDPSDM